LRTGDILKPFNIGTLERARREDKVMSWKCLSRALPFAVTATVAAFAAHAQSFPVSGKSISIIVPYAPGGVTDTGARLMAAGLEQELKTSVQVVNKAGAASQLGLTELVRSTPDGYTLSYAVLPTVTTHYLDPARQAIYTRANFQPVAMHHFTVMMLAVRTEAPYKTLKDFVEAARAKPGTIKISDSGLMAVPHTQVLMLERVANVRFAAVHFTGGAPSITALLGGHVDALSGSTADALANVKTGAFRVLSVSGDRPDKSMPEVPTMVSQGYDVQIASWAGIVAPAATPKPVIDRLTAAMKRVIESPEHAAKLVDLGIEPRYLSPDDYSKVWADIEARMKPLVSEFKN
jgi:tripartite-type tricarboxylate transporter receptor subunit TctC